MINILTAILNENINYKLKEYEKLCIKYDDIQYEEGLMEILENDNKIDVLIISSILFKTINLKNFMNLISKETIIILVRFKEEIFDYKENIIQIENNNEDELINNIIKIISKKFDLIINKISSINYLKEENEKIKTELEILKKIIEQNKETKLFNKIKNKVREKSIKKNENKSKIIKKGKIIIITGISKTGKTVLTSIIGKKLSEEKKVLLVDMDLENKNIITLFNKKKFDINNDKNILLNINNNLDLLSDIDIVLNDYKTNICEKLDLLLNQLLYKYEYIIFDFKVENETSIYKFLLNKSDKIIYLIEGDLLNIKNSTKMYERLSNISEKNKIQILLNKNNKNSIDKEVIEKIFNTKISFLLNYTSKVNKFINTNGNIKIDSKNITNLINIIKN